MRPYEIMVILDPPTLDERTVAPPSLETFLNVIRKDGGSVEKIDIWGGRRRMAYEILKHPPEASTPSSTSRPSRPRCPSWIASSASTSPSCGPR